MKKLRKLKDGGAVGIGVGGLAAGSSAIGGGLPKGLTDKNLSDKSVRPWIFENHRRIERADLKAHELEYMDLSKRENQILNQARKNRAPSKDFRHPEEAYKDFENKEMYGEGPDSKTFSDGSETVGFKENPEVYVFGATLFLVIWSLVLTLLFL